MKLEEIIRQGQDRLRGRPRDWRDDIQDWWQDFRLSDLFWRIYATLVIAYCATAFVGVIWFLFYK